MSNVLLVSKTEYVKITFRSILLEERRSEILEFLDKCIVCLCPVHGKVKTVLVAGS